MDLGRRGRAGSETRSRYTVWGSVNGRTWSELADRSDDTTVGFTGDPREGRYRHPRVDVADAVNDHDGNGAAWAAGLAAVRGCAEGRGRGCPR